MRVIGALIGLALVAIAPTQRTHATPVGAKRSALPLAAQALVSRTLGRDQHSYWVHDLKTRTKGLEAHFGSGGVVVRSGTKRLGLRLRAVGYGRALAPVEAALPELHENRVTYHRAALDEWYANGPLGLEQGFTVRAPPGRRTGPLTFALSLSGPRPSLAPDRRSLTFGSLRYTGLAAFDARGRHLPARLELSGRTLRIRVGDRGARYPLTIDPFIQQAKLTASDSAPNDGLGASVAIDGNTLVAGAPSADAVYVFVKPSSGWASATQTAKLTAVAPGTGLGFSVAISGDTIAAGAPDSGPATRQGAVFVFVKPPGGWADGTETARLTASHPMSYDQLGWKVAISGDTIVAGAPQTIAGGKGVAYVFVKPPGGWISSTETAKLTASDGVPGDRFGVAVGTTGDTVAVGASQSAVSGHAAQGAVYVFLRPGSIWMDEYETAKLTASDGAANDLLGWALAMSTDTIVAGAPTATVSGHSQQGAAYVFVRSATGWANSTQKAKLTASDGVANMWFGFAVGLSGDTAVVGAPFQPSGGTGQGAAYVFVKPANGWANATETSKPSASDGAVMDAFGYSVAIAGNFLVGGAPGYLGVGFSSGAAYVFARTRVTLTKRLQPASDPGRFDLRVGSTLVRAAAGDGASGKVDVAPGTYTVKEVGASGTALSDYVSSIACTLNGSAGPSGNGTSLSVTLVPGDVLACTLTNKRKATVTLTKHLVPSSDPGRFDLRAAGSLVVGGAGDGSSGSIVVAPGTTAILELPTTATSISNYLSSIACTRNGAPGPSNAGTVLQLALNPGDVLACTFTNTRAVTATIKLTKKLVPSSNLGRFDLKVGPTVVKYGAGNGGSGSLQVAPGTYTVHESPAPGTGNLSGYTTAISCTLNGAPGPTANGSSLTVSVVAGDVLACRLTNTAKALVILRKHLVPSFDPGRFDLMVGTTVVVPSAGEGAMGATTVVPGMYTVHEQSPGGGPIFGYSSSISCVLNGAPGPSGPGTSLDVSLAAGDQLDCTFINQKK